MSALAHSSAAERYAAFDPALPGSTLKEHWKYTRLRQFAEALQQTMGGKNALQIRTSLAAKSLVTVPSGASTEASAAEVLLGPALDWSKYPLADGLFSCAEGWQLRVDEGSQINAQISLGDGQGYGLVSLAPMAKAQIELNLNSQNHALAALLIDLQPGASLTLDTTALSAEGLCWLLTRVRLAENASLKLRQYFAGLGNHRLETHVLMAGAQSRANLLGASIAGEGCRLDQQFTVEHDTRDATSHQRFHCVGLARSQSNFNGRIHIHPGAQQTLAELNNRNLALADDAQLNTKPELEIYNDDVRCAHGATVGQLDADALFYSRSRGIPEAMARRLLTIGFLKQCVEGPNADAAFTAIEQLIA
ncbi:MAG: SufD family Fe-S cluster assembly protein [Pseudomonadales bacterium]